MKKLVVITALFFCFSCVGKQNVCTLSGNLENVEGNETLYLVECGTWRTVDSIIVTNGKFVHSVEVDHPWAYLLHNKRNQYPYRDRKLLWLEPGKITLNGNFDFLKHLAVEGSESNDLFDSYADKINKFEKKMEDLNSNFQNEQDVEWKKVFQHDMDSLEQAASASMVDLMKSHSSSYVTLYYLKEQIWKFYSLLDKNEIEEVYNSLSDELKASGNGKEIKDYITIPYLATEGKPAPDFELKDTEGNSIKLSDFKGKKVVLNFWSSSCGACRFGHKALRKFYAENRDKGVEMISISGDRDNQRWLNAVEQDSMTWLNVLDWDGEKNKVFILYNVKMMPTNVVIAPDGVVKRMGYFPVDSLVKLLEEI